MKRQQFKFWVDLHKSDEAYLPDVIKELKQGRVFMKAIRDGIVIVYDLLHGRVDALLALYPWVFDHIRAMPPTIEDQINERLEARLERMEQMMSYQMLGQGRAVERLPARELLQHPGIGSVDVAPPEDDGMSSDNFLNAFL
jgi:hypothetical protein